MTTIEIVLITAIALITVFVSFFIFGVVVVLVVKSNKA